MYICMYLCIYVCMHNHAYIRVLIGFQSPRSGDDTYDLMQDSGIWEFPKMGGPPKSSIIHL